MASSKIQGYNLDPNMGLAKEETLVEVKTMIENMSGGSGSTGAVSEGELVEALLSGDDA